MKKDGENKLDTYTRLLEIIFDIRLVVYALAKTALNEGKLLPNTRQEVFNIINKWELEALNDTENQNNSEVDT